MSFILERYGLDRRIIDILEDRKITELRKVQLDALKEGLLDGKNLFITAPSASGKTLIGEIAAVQNILKNHKKSIFLVPLRALANEKYKEFQYLYSKLGIKIAIRTGDYNLEITELANADLIISTYERFDSLLRNAPDWLNQINAVVVDEVHIINDFYRGPRLESLLARIRSYIPQVQLIVLSATIANPEELASWLGCKLIKSDFRPVKLMYDIIVTADKIKAITEIVIMTLKSKARGQVLIFTKTRREAQKLASDLVKIMINNNLLDAKESVELNQIIKSQDLTLKAKLDRSLINTMKFGVAYHHAGLSVDTRKLVEDNFRNHLIKVIACTTTLAEGVNLPAKVVIIKDCQVITMDPNILTCDDTYWWKNQLDKNLLHQILGRAGRPGYDNLGIGIILAPTNVDKNRIIEHYFHREGDSYIPKYAKVESQLNQREMLYEQVLVHLTEKGEMTQEEILEEFKNTYWWNRVHIENPEKTIDKLVEIGAISIEKTLNELTTAEIREKANSIPDEKVKITRIDEKFMEAIVSDNITQTCALFRDYPSCTCREFDYKESTNHIVLCRHLIKLIEVGMKLYPRVTNDLACLSLQREFILDSLLKMKTVEAIGNKYQPSPLGKLIIKLFIKPSSAIVIKARLSHIFTVSDVLETIEKLHVIEMNKYLDPMFVQIMIELVRRPEGTSLTKKILEASERYFKGQGDIEEYIDFSRWMAHVIGEIAHLYDFREVEKCSKIIEDGLIKYF